MVETAQTQIFCPHCRRVVNVLTRFHKDRDPEAEPKPFYEATDGQHDLKNEYVTGLIYPEVFVVACRVS